MSATQHSRESAASAASELVKMLEHVRDRCENLGIPMQASMGVAEAALIVQTHDATELRVQPPARVVVHHERGIVNQVTASSPVEVLFLEEDVDNVLEEDISIVDGKPYLTGFFAVDDIDDPEDSQVALDPEETDRIFDLVLGEGDEDEEYDNPEPGPREKPFAKLFGEGRKQVLVQLTNDEGPKIRICFKLKSLGICQLAHRFESTPSGWAAAEALFEELTANEKTIRAEIKRIEKSFIVPPARYWGPLAVASNNNAPFAKLYGSDGQQVLVVMSPGDDELGVDLYAWPNEFTQQTSGVSFGLTPQDLAAARALFDELDETSVRRILSENVAD